MTGSPSSSSVELLWSDLWKPPATLSLQRCSPSPLPVSHSVFFPGSSSFPHSLLFDQCFTLFLQLFLSYWGQPSLKGSCPLGTSPVTTQSCMEHWAPCSGAPGWLTVWWGGRRCSHIWRTSSFFALRAAFATSAVCCI